MKKNLIEHELQKLGNKAKAKDLMRFFKTGPGQYGEGDVFIGLTVPQQRIIAKKYAPTVDEKDIIELLRSPIHEYRMTALCICVHLYIKGDTNIKKRMFTICYNNRKWINNWDLVDLIVPTVIGGYLFEKHTEKKILYKWAYSKNLWERRIAIISTFAFIKKNVFEDTLAIAEILLYDKHDLIHKAVGWMLREIGKRNREVEEKFLKKHYKEMPRTMLRYAIEHFEEEKRQKYLKGHI